MASPTIPIKLTPQILLALAVLIFGVGMGMGKYLGGRSLGAEGFTASSLSGVPVCSACSQSQDGCKCTPKGMARLICPPCREPDMSKYVLKSSIPKQQPVIIDNSSCTKEAGECPPCPRPRCPEVKCPAPTVCPAPAPCPRPVYPTQTVKCKTEVNQDSSVRPYLTPLNMSTFGSSF